MEMPDLATLAMLGEASKGFFDQFGIDTKSTYEKAMEDNKELSPEIRIKVAMSAVTEEVLTKAPVWMRINMLSHKISRAKSDGIAESDIDWKKINQYLTVNTTEGDYNNFDEVGSYSDFSELGSNFIMAQADLAPWRRITCKDCGKEFYMMQSEMAFYVKKELSLPKRCRACRDKRKGIIPQEVPKVSTKKPEAPAPTAMEIAMRKAGLIE